MENKINANSYDNFSIAKNAHDFDVRTSNFIKKTKTHTFQELDVWKNAHNFVLMVYKITEIFPKNETFGLASQFRRAAVSIAANIAEGYKKKGKLDKIRLLNIAQGSLEECHYYVILSKDLSYIDAHTAQNLFDLIEITGKMLNSYCKKIEIDFNASKLQSSNF